MGLGWMDAAGGWREIHVNLAARRADPGAGGAVSREAAAPGARL